MKKPEPASSTETHEPIPVSYAAGRSSTFTLLKNNLTRAHLWIFLALLITFGLFTGFITNGNADDDERGRVVSITVLCTITGPFTGAASRGWQGCCTRFSASLLPYSGSLLLITLALQFLRLPFKRGALTLRLTLWFLGWFGWFASGIFSFAHALS